MKKILGDIWYNYAMEKCSNIDTEAERDAMRKLTEADNRLRETLNDKQISELEEVCGLLSKVDALFIEKAFESGVHFATRYILEVMEKQDQ